MEKNRIGGIMSIDDIQKDNDWRFYVEHLRSEECQCGKPKKRGRSLCYSCWKQLPYDYRMGLWLKLGDGYEEAYDAACKWLNI